MHRARAILVCLGLAALAGCGGSSEQKIGGAWPSQPVKCSAYLKGSEDYDACMARDREATARAV